MRRDGLRTIVLFAGAATAGVLGWSGQALMLPASLAFPALWSLAPSRVSAALVSAAYFLAASRGLPRGVTAFYRSDIGPGLILWLIASTGFVAVHALLWSGKGDGRKALNYLTAMLLLAVPPLGIVGWAHPITAAGIIFPGCGWLGLGAMAIGLAVMTTRGRAAVAVVVIGLWILSAIRWPSPDPGQDWPSGWQAVSLGFGMSLGRDPTLARHRELASIVRSRRLPGGLVMVLPESALGFWTPTLERFWQQQLAGSGLTVIAGAAIVGSEGYDNVLLRISEHDSEILYNERMPVPGSMWQPWRFFTGQKGGARAFFFANPVAVVADRRIAPLICYEQLIIWPVIQSMRHHPDVIVAVGNGWWTRGTNIVAIQQASALAWSRLFAIPLILSFNL